MQARHAPVSLAQGRQHRVRGWGAFAGWKRACTGFRVGTWWPSGGRGGGSRTANGAAVAGQVGVHVQAGQTASHGLVRNLRLIRLGRIARVLSAIRRISQVPAADQVVFLSCRRAKRALAAGRRLLADGAEYVVHADAAAYPLPRGCELRVQAGYGGEGVGVAGFGDGHKGVALRRVGARGRIAATAAAEPAQNQIWQRTPWRFLLLLLLPFWRGCSFFRQNRSPAPQNGRRAICPGGLLLLATECTLGGGCGCFALRTLGPCSDVTVRVLPLEKALNFPGGLIFRALSQSLLSCLDFSRVGVDQLVGGNGSRQLGQQLGVVDRIMHSLVVVFMLTYFTRAHLKQSKMDKIRLATSSRIMYHSDAGFTVLPFSSRTG
eukprot:m.124756 g.124756  ORF g.124756 m.124756 type:complete len:377 (+) comp19757_c3_seq2:615-1745(+)